MLRRRRCLPLKPPLPAPQCTIKSPPQQGARSTLARNCGALAARSHQTHIRTPCAVPHARGQAALCMCVRTPHIKLYTPHADTHAHSTGYKSVSHSQKWYPFGFHIPQRRSLLPNRRVHSQARFTFSASFARATALYNSQWSELVIISRVLARGEDAGEGVTGDASSGERRAPATRWRGRRERAPLGHGASRRP